jgi:predicted NBD/HSP70 family sugar kinase
MTRSTLRAGQPFLTFNDQERQGCGPMIPSLSESPRPLRQQIFERVRAAGQMPRVQVARELAISPASVTTLTSELIELGLLEEVSTASEGARGRPAVSLGVRAAAHYVGGVKLWDRGLIAVVMDFAGNVMGGESIPRDPGPVEPAELIRLVAEILTRVCANIGLKPGDLSAVGLGLPGFVDTNSGIAHWCPVLSERHVPVAAMAAEVLGLPVNVDNDANLVTLAELWFGAGRRLSDFAVVTIEHGVGMGFVLNHRIYRGAQGLGTELGHTKVQLDGALCRCGQRGCLEAYIADYALAREATTALNWSSRETQSMNILLESLYDHAKAGNAAARSIFHRAGRYLALGLANVVNLFDPELIILSGERMRYDYLYAKETLAEIEALALNTGRPAPRIEIHAWGDLLWGHGAAALALSAVTEGLLGPSRDTPAA